MYEDLWQENNYENIVKYVLGLKSHWDIDLNSVDGMAELVTKYLENIDKNGVERALEEVK